MAPQARPVPARAKERSQLILPTVFFVIFTLLYVVFHSVTEAAVLIFPDDPCTDGRPDSANEGRVRRLRPKLATVCVVLANLVPILWETGIDADLKTDCIRSLSPGFTHFFRCNLAWHVERNSTRVNTGREVGEFVQSPSDGYRLAFAFVLKH
jgi:hypothetical protein